MSRAKTNKTKYIFISGGVISGLGKGIVAASIGLLLKSRGIKVTLIKCDAYVNLDAGTIRPQEHGEVFVTSDGVECDQDIGTYERFIDENLSRVNYVTTGQIYQSVIQKERNFEYKGEDVEVVPHIPEEMIRRLKEAANKTGAEIVIIEIGGTVGEYQNILFLEANRIMKYRDREKVIHIHVGYLPTPPSLGEMKSKPLQNSVRTLNATGIQPDFIIGRAEKKIDDRRKERIAWLCNVSKEDIISDPDVENIYQVPLIFEEQKLAEKIMNKLGRRTKKDNLQIWKKMIKKTHKLQKRVKIALVGKYFASGDYILTDVYISVIEAIKHAAWANNVKPEISWLDSEIYEKNSRKVRELKNYDGVIVPGGFGQRGVEGKIKTIEFCRKNKIPFLGLCYGMQLAVIEFARNVCGLKEAQTTENNPETKNPVIDLLPEQKEKIKEKNYGGSMRLGDYFCQLKKNTASYKAYGQEGIFERHRHRYELNNKYRNVLEKHGLVLAGLNPDQNLVEVIELKNHPFFVATQFHPEFKSRPLRPHPLFKVFIKKSIQH